MGMLGGSLASLAVVVSMVTAAPSPSALAPPSAAPASDCAATTLTITNADNGKTICVRPGTRITVKLTNATQPLQYTGPLEPGSPKAFTALSEGAATIYTVISPCASASGTVHCMVLELFRVRVEIRAGS